MSKYKWWVAAVVTLAAFTAQAGDIRYGYNAKGEYVPVEIDGQQVDYGYNAKGEYVPVKIGNQQIDYGFNAKGDYVPTKVGNNNIDYGYNKFDKRISVFDFCMNDVNIEI